MSKLEKLKEIKKRRRGHPRCEACGALCFVVRGKYRLPNNTRRDQHWCPTFGCLGVK